MKPTYLLVGLIFLALTPALLLASAPIEKGYGIPDSETSITKHVPGNFLAGYILGWVAVVPLWACIPLIVYGINSKSDDERRERKSKLVFSGGAFFIYYSIALLGLYSYIFLLHPIYPLLPLNMLDIQIRVLTIFAIALTIVISSLFLTGTLKLSNNSITNIIGALILLVSGGILIFSNKGGALFTNILGSKISSDYSTFFSFALVASGIASGITTMSLYINCKRKETAQFIKRSVEKLPLMKFDPDQIPKLEINFKDKVKNAKHQVFLLKRIFFLVFAVALVSSAYFLILNTLNLLNSLPPLLEDPLFQSPMILGQITIWYALSIIPLSLFIIFFAFLSAIFRRTPIGSLCSDKELNKLVENISCRIGITPPKLIITGGLRGPYLSKIGNKHLLWISSDFVNNLREQSDIELQAVIAHELFHIKNKDANDSIIINSVQQTLRKSFYWLSLISIPFIVLLPVSFGLLDLLPFWIVFILAALFLILLRFEIPYLFLPLVLSTLAAIIYIPIALLLAKYYGYIEMNTDLEAAEFVGNPEAMKKALIMIEESEITERQTVQNLWGSLSEIPKEKIISEILLKAPSIVIDGIHKYCIAKYSSIKKRVKNIEEKTVLAESAYTIVGRIAFFIKFSLADFITNEYSRAGLVMGAIYVGPWVALLANFTVVKSIPISILYGLLATLIVSKATKYAFAVAAEILPD